MIYVEDLMKVRYSPQGKPMGHPKRSPGTEGDLRLPQREKPTRRAC
jgi:hypothetical protein